MKKIIFMALLIIGQGNAWEVNTHRAIDKTAIEEVNPRNLVKFLEASGIGEVDYVNERFEGYGVTYFEYFDDNKSSDAMAELKQKFANNHNYQDLLEAGSMLEDAQWQNNALFGANGRFLNHFYNPQDGGDGLWWDANAVDWAKGLAGSRHNDYSYPEAMRYFKKGFSEPDPNERRRFQAKMLVSVGHLMHLVNDMNVPAHTRADAHPFGDPLEVWMRGGMTHEDDTGFYVRGSSIANARYSASALMLKYEKFEDGMINEATYTSENFFSKDSIGTLDLPSMSEMTIPELDENHPADWDYVTDSRGRKMAVVYWSHWFGQKRITIDNSYASQAVHEEYGKDLIPRAIANAAGFLNYFFRGSIKAEASLCGVKVTNVSDTRLVANTDTVTLRKGGKIAVYYDTGAEKRRHPLIVYPLVKDLPPGKSVMIPVKFTKAVQEEMGKNQSLTIVYDGDIGKERGVSVTRADASQLHPQDPPQITNGAVDMTLNWNYECDIDMDLSMVARAGSKGAPYIRQDLKDIEGYGKEHAYIDSEEHLFPGDHYDFKANGSKIAESELDKETLAEEPVEIRALLETPTGSYFRVWEIKDFGQLDIGKFAELDIEENKTAQPKWNDNSGGYSGGRTYDECPKSAQTKSCKCVPCKYLVAGMERRVEDGSIAGAEVSILKASDSDEIAPTILWRGTTTDDADLFKTGLFEISSDRLSQFDDDTYYEVRVKGGEDVDYDDDMKRDLSSVKNNGVIHAVIKGSDLKRLPFRVNILTEAIYQVTGSTLGDRYDPQALETTLDTIAKKILTKKLNPKENDAGINYSDVLFWTPAVDKKALYKPFDLYVMPIIERLYADKERYDLAYKFIYEPYDSEAPQLSPAALTIPAGLPDDTIIATLAARNDKPFASIETMGRFAEHFHIDDKGYVYIAKSASIRPGNRYRLQVRAVDSDGKKGSYVTLSISVEDANTTNDPTKSTPRFLGAEIHAVYENSKAGTEVGRVHFEDSNQTIVAYRLIGEDNASFAIDKNGIITVAEGADIDYERSKLYAFRVAAVNDAGNESFPVRLTVPIKNRLDTPLFDVVVFEHIEENTPLGTVVTKIRKDREGLGEIEKFEILTPHIPFTIDNNGTLTVTDYIDYEQKKRYNFYAIARTKYGSSNKIEIHIVVDNLDPETGVPHLEDTTLSIEENASSGSRIGTLTAEGNATDMEEIALYGDAEKFRVDANGTLYLAENATLDYETKRRYALKAKARNNRGWGREAKIVVEVGNIPDALPVLENFRGSIEENATAGMAVGQIVGSATFEVPIDAFTLTGTGSENFAIDRNGTISVSSSAQLDYESRSRYLLHAVATGGNGLSREVQAIIDILDIVDSPPILVPFKGSVEENATKGTVIGKVRVDSKYTDSVTGYTIVRDPYNVLQIDQNGTVRLAKEGVLDYEKSDIYLFDVTASNRYGTSDPMTMRLTVLDGGVPPKITDLNVTVPFGQIWNPGLFIGKLAIDDGDSPITKITLEGEGSEHFNVEIDGNITLLSDMETDNNHTELQYHLKVTAYNKFGKSTPAAVTITFEPKPVINAGSDIALYANESFTLHGTIDEAYRTQIKEIRWSSPQTDKIDCVETNTTECDISQGLLVGEYEAVLTVMYRNGYQQSDSLKITVEADPFDNILGVIEKPLAGLKQMRLSKDGTKIYAVGNFDGDDIFKVIDVSDPKQMQIIASFAYGDNLEATDIALDDNETKVAIVADGYTIVIDISDLYALSLISSRYYYWSQYAYDVEWYRDNLIAINNWHNSGDYSYIAIVDADTMDVNQTLRFGDKWIERINIIPKTSLLIYQISDGMYIYDINQSKTVYRGNEVDGNIVADSNATHLIYNGERPVYHPEENSYYIENYYGLLDISNINHISEQEIKSGLLLGTYYGDIPYRMESNTTIDFYDSGYYYSILKEFTFYSGKSSVSHVKKIEGDIKNIALDEIHKVLYLYTSDGLKAILDKDRNSGIEFTYRLQQEPEETFSYFNNFAFTYNDFLFRGYGIYDMKDIYKPHKVGTFDFRKSCDPDCGYDIRTTLPLSNAKIVEDQLHIVSPGSPVDHWMFDISDKNQTFSLQLPPKYDDKEALGSDFAISQDGRYIYTFYTFYTEEATDETRYGISLLDTETNEQKNFVVGSTKYWYLREFSIKKYEHYLYAMIADRLYIFDIQEKMNVTLLTEESDTKIKAFVLSKIYKKVYTFSNRGIEIYTIKNDGRLNKVDTIALQSKLLDTYDKIISISPDESRLAINTKFGIRLYSLDNDGFINRDRYIDIVYPETETPVDIGFITWIDNTTFVAGWYIVKIKNQEP